ncbi:MAG: hypothetical protein A2087_09570 [Spirochaetes bacterium GWD1_61_31]|nr:MAG: hypothetical protein A2Y37_07165 [Spirochaetes bacterium GWB1_60_80]OHD29251.1 MAG: hypothetical protein A2004_09075 [Spirochaetes bacterium GWC1_61_12]OHD39252.1 MAG: hypothetical protein A2087_09570 [Spirochaetes bacterium GWD1_61_31]OHD43655.1 MAG: hypothetical protein A2Y35_06360 [Spirochaetes bacterium GWE1_60_18]OHD59160.1 MAG: hypothetical protein A2Y32_14850 [Spirochaetes bacterium GWF1_60_12]
MSNNTNVTPFFGMIMAVWLLACSSCGLIDLRPVVVVAFPAGRNQVLAAADSYVALNFPAAVDKVIAEKIFKVMGPGGAISGDYDWIDNECRFTPYIDWQPTVAYRLQAQGVVPLLDGRIAKLNYDSSFYAMRASPGPCLASYTPLDRSTTSVFPADDALVTLLFSEAMDIESVQKAFKLNPAIDITFTWNSDNTFVSCVPKRALQPCAVYEWSLASEATSADGSLLDRAESGVFLTILDVEAPSLNAIVPMHQVDGLWELVAPTATAADFETTDAIGFQFSEAVQPASVASAIKFEPSLQGRFEQLAGDVFVYVPQKDFNPESEYTVVVSAGLLDLPGIQHGTEQRFAMSIVTPWLTIDSISAADPAEILTSPVAGQVLQVTILATGGELSLTINFNQAIGAEAAIDVVSRISLSGFFPASTASGITLKSAAWLTAVPTDILVLVYTGLIQSTPTETCIYKLSIPGGLGGISNGLNSRMEDDFQLYLEIKQ